MANRKRRCLLAGCVLLCGFARAQHQPDKEFVFSGIATETMCRQLPAPSFTIGPSGDRYASRDRLTVKCIPGLLTLTFTIDASVPSAHDQNIYTFRWGKAIVQGHTGFEGQFTRHEKLCTELTDLFYLTLSKTPTSVSEPALEPMHWSATCNGDDALGTTMEIEASPHAEARNPRDPIK